MKEKNHQFKYKLFLHCSRHLRQLNFSSGYHCENHDHCNKSCMPFTRIMPTIKLNCPNIVKLQLTFIIINDEDFVDIFRFMPDLKSLEIEWSNHKSIPVTFIESLNRITDTLEELKLSTVKFAHYTNEIQYDNFPDSFVSVSIKNRSY